MPAGGRVEGVAKLHPGTDHFSDLQKLPAHTLSRSFVLTCIGEVVALPAGNAALNVEHAAAAPTVRTNEPFAAASVVAGRFRKGDALMHIAPTSMNRDENVIAMPIDPCVEGVAWFHIGNRQGAAPSDQTGVSDILDAQLHHVVGEAIGAVCADSGHPRNH